MECSHSSAYLYQKSRDLPFAQVVAWSPRGVAGVDRRGAHRYADRCALADIPAGCPWTLHLTDTDGRFWLLGFDFDDHDGHQAQEVGRDVATLARWCNNQNVPYLVCASGGGAGRHVWIRLTAPAGADMVAGMARGLRQLLSTLDITPLCNPTSGMLRAPGSPHRSGGASTPLPDRGRTIAGQLAHASAGTSPDVVDALAAWAGTHTTTNGGDTDSRSVTVTKQVRGIDHTRQKLTGPTRPLPEQAQKLADTPLADTTDASPIARTILLHMAHRRWALADVLTAADTMPGLVHLTHQRRRHGTGRTRRARPGDYIRRQWADALDAAAHYPTSNTPDREPIDDTLTAALHAAHQDPQLAAGTRGAALRIVYYALITVARQARSLEVDLSIRRWALACGMTKSSLHRYLQLLLTTGWIIRTHIGAGTQADTYRLVLPADNSVPSPGVEVPGTQRYTPPAGWGLPTGLAGVEARLAHHRRDVWTDGGLGLAAAEVHAALLDGADYWDCGELAEVIGFDRDVTESLVAALRADHLVFSSHLEGVDVDEMYAAAAKRHRVTGVLEARRRWYEAESVAWAWWCDELAWRRSYGSGGRYVGLQETYGRFPQLPGQGGMDWTAAVRKVLHRASRSQRQPRRRSVGAPLALAAA